MLQTKNKLETNNRMALWKEWLFTIIIFSLIFVGTELILHVLVFGLPNRRIIYPILFAFCLTAFFTGLCFLLPPLAQKILGTIAAVACIVWAMTQYIYQAIFGSFMPVSQLGLGGNVVDFRSQLVYCIKENVLQLLLLLLPLVIFLVLLFCKKILRKRLSWRQGVVSLLAMILAAAAAFALMYAARNTRASVYKMFQSSNTKTTVSYETVGMAATTAQEIRFMIFPEEEERSVLETAVPAEGALAEASSGDYNAVSIDFDALAASTEDPDLKKLDKYFSGVAPSKKNEYTGLLKGGNVIVLCAESFSNLIIDKDLTPTLYKMATNGFVFNNFYGTFKSVTTNGEYTTCTGLFPDLSRKKVASTFDESIGNYLPYCLGNALKDQGYLAYAYHNYIGEFYNRNLTHTNMGYTFKSASDGLNITMQWPASDLEMMEQSVDDYISSGQPFTAYYMTFSGHYQYDWYNAMSAKNRSRVEHLPYSDPVKAFIACNLELEDALTYLIDRLEQEGLMEKTLIVLTNDHYPYGLKKEQYSELAGYEVDTTFEKYRNSFLCYTKAVDQPVIVDDYCCTADILPTILNLIGYEYDSRLLAGTDVLSDSPHVAVLETGSYLTNDFRYNADNGVATTHDGLPSEASKDEIDYWTNLVEQKMELSREVLNHNYYSHVFDKSGLNQSMEEDSVNFSDVKSIFAQSSISWVVSKGYMDPISETEFGSKIDATLGEFLDSLYRVNEKPSASMLFLPKDYCGVNGDSFNKSHPYYDAVCWAFEKNLIRVSDKTYAFDAPISYMDTAVILYRFCKLYNVKFQLTPEGEDEKTLMKELAAAFPERTQEQLEAMTWCFGEHIIALSKDLYHQIDTSDNIVYRSRLVTYLFRTCVYELNMS